MFEVLCSSCANAIFDERWGEWKCVKHIRYIYDMGKASFCKNYIEKKKEKKT